MCQVKNHKVCIIIILNRKHKEKGCHLNFTDLFYERFSILHFRVLKKIHKKFKF